MWERAVKLDFGRSDETVRSQTLLENRTLKLTGVLTSIEQIYFYKMGTLRLLNPDGVLVYLHTMFQGDRLIRVPDWVSSYRCEFRKLRYIHSGSVIVEVDPAEVNADVAAIDIFSFANIPLLPATAIIPFPHYPIIHNLRIENPICEFYNGSNRPEMADFIPVGNNAIAVSAVDVDIDEAWKVVIAGQKNG